MSSGARLEAAIHAGVAAPLSLVSLHFELKKRLTAVAAKFPLLETKPTSLNPPVPGTPRVPSIFDGWVPPKPGGDAEQFPFLIVRPSSGVDTIEGEDQLGSAVLKIIIGTYSDTDDGWLDVLLLIEAIRSDLDEQPTIAGTAFQHWGPLAWEIPAEQPRPQWFGIVTTNWNISRPRRIEARNSLPQQED